MTDKRDETPEQVATAPGERTFGMLSHLLGIVTSVVGPLVIVLAKGKGSPFVRGQAVEAVNFQITVIIGYLVSWTPMIVAYLVGTLTLLVIGFAVLWAVWIGSLICVVIASIAASRGRPYRYPVNIRMVK